MSKGLIGAALASVLILVAPAAASAGVNGDKDPAVEPEVQQYAPDGLRPVDVEVNGTNVTATIDGVDIGIELPGEISTAASSVKSERAEAEGLVAHDGNSILDTFYEGSTTSTYETKSGSQTLIEVPSSSAPREYRFPLDLPDGVEAVAAGDGSILILSPDGPLGYFKKPWARDANGDPVATEFHLEGDVLVQTVHFSEETAFPVVADPDFGSAWWGWFWRATTSETQRIADYSGDIQAITGIVSSFCMRIPHAGASATCVAVAAAVSYSVGLAARTAVSQGRCIAFNVPWATVVGAGPHVSIVTCTR